MLALLPGANADVFEQLLLSAMPPDDGPAPPLGASAPGPRPPFFFGSPSAGSMQVEAAPLEPSTSSAQAGPFSAAATAEARAAPGKRPPGRPPKADGSDYSKQYLRLKAYRQRKQDSVAGLATTLHEKMAQLELLTAENEALQFQELVLTESIKSEVPCTPAPTSTAAGASGGSCSSSDAGVRSRTPSVNYLAPPDGGLDGSGGSGAFAANQQPGGAPAADAAPFSSSSATPQRSPAFTQVLEAVASIMQQLRALVPVDAASAAPPPPGLGSIWGASAEAVAAAAAAADLELLRKIVTGQPLQVLRLHMCMSPEENYRLLITNLVRPVSGCSARGGGSAGACCRAGCRAD